MAPTMVYIYSLPAFQLVHNTQEYRCDVCQLNAEMDNLIGSLKDAGLCKDVHYKELYIPQAELEGNCHPLPHP